VAYTWRKYQVAERQALRRLYGRDLVSMLDAVEDACFQIHHLIGNGGYMSTNGSAPGIEWEAQQVGEDVTTYEHLLKQLLKQDILARTETGVLFSPSLVNQIHLSTVRRSAGSEGGKKTQDILLELKAKQKSSSISVSSSTEGECEGEGNATSAFDDFLDEASLDIARLLCDRLNAEKPNRAPTSEATVKSWAKTTRLMMTSDFRDPARIIDVMNWHWGAGANRDFRHEVEAASSLRNKFDKIEDAMNRKPTASTKEVKHEKAMPLSEWEERAKAQEVAE